MKNRQIKLLISDIKSLIRMPLALCMLVSPIIISLFLLFVFPLTSGLNGTHGSVSFGGCYLFTAITLISAIPLINGHLISINYPGRLQWTETNGSGITPGESGNSLFTLMAISAFISFLMVLPVIYLTDPVPTEGWLRSIYAAFLLSISAPFIFLLEAAFERSLKRWMLITFISILYLSTLPSGLMLHHPWNYFVFFSPFYWFGWAWVIASPAESILYGIISLAVSTLSMLVFYRFFVRNSVTQ